jgi:sensor histidine kinase YesM
MARIQDVRNFHTPFYVIFTKITLAAFPFYVSAYVVFPSCFTNKRNSWRISFIVLLFVFANALIRFVALKHVVPYITNTQKPQATIYQFFILSLNWLIQYSMLGLGFWYALKSIKTERKLRVTETEKLILKNQQLQLRYNYLQAQINPHFLYNTLNFLYTEAEAHSEKLAGAIIALSGIMRYSVSERSEKDMVSLEQELEVLEKYIHLHQLRFGSKLNVVFRKEVVDETLLIPPYILITIVENAFKHGLFTKEYDPMVIHLHSGDGRLSFSTENVVNTAVGKQQSSGVGLHNISERLRLAYGENQRFAFRKENDKFIVELEINFERKRIAKPLQQTTRHD